MPDPSPTPAAAEALSRDDVAHLARLARIECTDAELDRLVGELGVILESVAQVSAVAADDVPPMSHPLPLTNVTRPDVRVAGLTRDEALSGAPASEQHRFRVPRILEED
jgi:aspartyl-tRNA(Asn)/glutamyl-tRNA(Gln) amidotransferase subunit C